MPDDVRLDADQLREIVSYDPETGIMRWRVSLNRRLKIGDVCGYLDTLGYWIIQINGMAYKAHRLAWLYVHGEWPVGFIDHRNEVKRDNWIDNLREATAGQNIAHQPVRRTTTSGLKGAYPQRGKFVAKITEAGKTVHLGTFDTAKLAHERYVLEATRLHGEFAHA